MSLATKYRPKEFSEVIGQTSVVQILEKQLETGNISHSYLFCGASGCGKTTIARIFATKLNGSFDGLIEMDAASNNGVENIRNIVKSAKERSISTKYKIFILDECHALTNQSWQSLLKCIEEPPEFTIFMFCTTDPQKVPQTIQNRCQRYNITKLSVDAILARLKYIAEKENISVNNDVLLYLTKLSEGSVRQAITYLEQASNMSSVVSMETAVSATGGSVYTDYFTLANAIVDRDQKEICKVVESIYNSGKDFKLFIDQFFGFCLDLTKYSLFKSISITNIPPTYSEDVKNSTNFDHSEKYYMYITDKLLNIKNGLKGETTPKQFVEAGLLRIAEWN